MAKKKPKKKRLSFRIRFLMLTMLLLCVVVFLLLVLYVNHVGKFYSLTFKMGQSLDNLAGNNNRFFVNILVGKEWANASSLARKDTPSFPWSETRKIRRRPSMLYKIMRKVELMKKVTKFVFIPTENPNTCKKCFKHEYKYLIDNTHACANHDSMPIIDVVIVIFTIHEHQFEREILRETWLSYAKNNTSNVRYVFLLGNSKKEKLERALKEESRKYKDIVQDDFIESYSNLTYKTLMGFKWATSRCSGARFIMKTDDDVFVNIPGLLNTLKTYGDALLTKVGGSCFKRAVPHRRKGSKYYASEENYPNHFYPGYCSGTGYVTSIRMAANITSIAKNVPFFYLEDIYVSICVSKLGYSLLPLPGFHFDRVMPKPCTYKSIDFVMSHNIDSQTMEWIWKKKCKDIVVDQKIKAI